MLDVSFLRSWAGTISDDAIVNSVCMYYCHVGSALGLGEMGGSIIVLYILPVVFHVIWINKIPPTRAWLSIVSQVHYQASLQVGNINLYSPKKRMAHHPQGGFLKKCAIPLFHPVEW